LKHANAGVSERLVRLDNNWIQFESQLNFFQRVRHVMEEEHREVYSNTLQVLQNKLEIVVSLLKKLVKLKPGCEEELSSPTYKVNRLRYAAKHNSLDEAIKDLEVWQGLANQSWFLLLRIADTQIDQVLTSGSVSEPSTGTTIPAAVDIRAGLQHVDDSTQGVSAVQHITLRSSDLKSMATNEVPFSDGITVATRTHSNRSVSRYILNQIQCDTGAKPQILKRNVRDLVRKLQVDEPYTFGLLNCKGFVAESVPAGLTEHLSLTLVFREPPGSLNPKSLRNVLVNTPTSMSTTQRLDIARDLARSVSYVHTFGFVHKNVRPESVLIFDRANGQGMSAFLVGFENFRRDEGWTQRQGDDAPDKNLYRHPSRQGFKPQDDYEMRHDIYSLGVCLLEIGLWDSFVKHHSTTPVRSLSRLLTAPSEKGKEVLSESVQAQARDRFIALARCRLPGSMGDRYTEIVQTCLTCLDAGNVDFGDEKAFEDENGILVGTRYIEKVLLRLGKLTM
jgi:hypothetical protein